MAEIDMCSTDVLPSSSKKGKSPFDLTIESIESMKKKVDKNLPKNLSTPYLNKFDSIISLFREECS